MMKRSKTLLLKTKLAKFDTYLAQIKGSERAAFSRNHFKYLVASQAKFTFVCKQTFIKASRMAYEIEKYLGNRRFLGRIVLF